MSNERNSNVPKRSGKQAVRASGLVGANRVRAGKVLGEKDFPVWTECVAESSAKADIDCSGRRER